MSYMLGEGIEHVCMLGRLLCLSQTRNAQYHVDVVGRTAEAQELYDWCEHAFGPPAVWRPFRRDAQWHDRFDTDVWRVVGRRWTCRNSPWVAGDIENFHLILWDNAATAFEDCWRQSYFEPVDWFNQAARQ